jgi:DNA adenine methylase
LRNAAHPTATYNQVDHEALFQLTATVSGDFLMTYENCEEMQAHAGRHGFDFEPISMQNRHHAKLTELLIGRDLGWLRSLL